MYRFRLAAPIMATAPAAKRYGLETVAVHAGEGSADERICGAATLPVFQSSTYVRDKNVQGWPRALALPGVRDAQTAHQAKRHLLHSCSALGRKCENSERSWQATKATAAFLKDAISTHT